MREGAALGVLSREADRNPVLEEGRKGESLGVPPVDTAVSQALAPAIELPCELRVDLESVGHLEQLVAELEQTIGRDRRHDRGARVRLRRGLRTRNRRRKARAELVMRGAELGERVLEHACRVVRAHHALRRQPRAIRLAHRHLLVDALGLERLRVRRLVLLVVAEAAVADEIHDDVVPELLAIRESESDRGQRGLGIVRVDVHDRNVEALREVARISRRTAFGGIRGEPDLVVRDQMQRPTGRVPVEAVQIEGLGHDALPGERRVAVDEHRERHGRIVDPRSAGAIGLLGARKALDHGVDRLQMAGVGRDGDLDLAGIRHA